jgi:hypothetical protein
MKIQWKCNEEKIGWRVAAELPLPGGVKIQTDVVIPRWRMSPTAMMETIVDSNRAINEARMRHEQFCKH